MWGWVNTYRYIFSEMNIHLPAILGFTRYQGFDPSPYQVYQLWGKMVENTYQPKLFSVLRGVRGGRPKNLQSMFHHFGLSHDTGHVDCSVSPGTFSLAGCYDVNMGKSSTCQGGSKLPNRNPTHQPSTHTTSEWLLHPTPLNLQEMSKLGNLEPQSAEFNVGMPKLEGYNLETLDCNPTWQEHARNRSIAER
jgi:hypothetical protein